MEVLWDLSVDLHARTFLLLANNADETVIMENYLNHTLI